MVLDHVADRAGLFVEGAAPLDAEALGHRDLHALDAVAVPDRLEELVGEAEEQDVEDRLLAEVMVDPEDPPTSSNVSCRIRFSSRADLRSRPNGFSITTRAPSAHARLARFSDDRAEETRWYRQVVERVRCLIEGTAATG